MVPRHAHLDFIELTIVTDGRGTVITNGESVEVAKGDIYVSFVGDFHEIISSSDEPLKYDFLAIQSSEGDILTALDEIVAKFHDPKCRIIRNEDIAETVPRIIAELNAQEAFSDSVIESMLRQVLVYVIRAFYGRTPTRYSKMTGEAEVLCYQLMHYIDTHVFTITHLSELCEITNYNYNYLSNLYKRVTSDTLANYFRNRRLETARLLLLEGKISVTRVASLLNYSSVYIFSRAFKEKYGVPPSKMYPGEREKR